MRTGLGRSQAFGLWDVALRQTRCKIVARPRLSDERQRISVNPLASNRDFAELAVQPDKLAADYFATEGGAAV